MADDTGALRQDIQSASNARDISRSGKIYES